MTRLDEKLRFTGKLVERGNEERQEAIEYCFVMDLDMDSGSAAFGVVQVFSVN